MNVPGAGSPTSKRFAVDQIALVAIGLASFVLGVSVHRDRATLAVALVALGGVLVVLGALLPRIQTLGGKFAGVEFQLGLVERPSVATDRNLASASAGGLPPTDLRGAGAPRSGPAGFADATKGGPADIVVVNLEGGRAWLTSRLYVFVAALIELRGVEAVVFTHRPGDHDVVLGVSPACAVLERLGWSYPWLPEALGAAWHDVRVDSEVSVTDRLPASAADRLYEQYVGKLGHHQGVNRPDEWVTFENGMRERASWIDSALARTLLGGDLSQAMVREARDSRDPGVQVLERESLAYAGTRFVIVVSEMQEFRSVIDRFAVLEAMWRAATSDV